MSAMSSLAIPSAPPPPSASTGSGSTPATGDQHFGDTLRQTQSKPQTQAGKGPHDDATDTPASSKQADRAPNKHAKPGTKDDKADKTPTKNDSASPPASVPAVPVTTVVARQAPAANGNPLPATKPSAAVAASGKTATTTTAGIKGITTIIAPAGVPPAGVPAAAAAGPNAAINATATAQTSEPAIAVHTGIDASDAAGTKDMASTRLDPGNFTAHLSQLIGGQSVTTTSQAPAPTSAPASTQLSMQATPTQPQFAQEAAQHVAWMAGQGIQKAEIQLNPRALGPIHVDITTHHDHVDVNFAVQHPQTVNALQQTLPQLHDMLAQQGLNLGQASVGQQSPGQQHAAFAQHAGGGNPGGHAGNAEPEPAPVWRPLRITAPGGVDDFA